ncbi:MAG TPA: GNAT family N-acetyltransferase [Chitinophagaceae bacterium]|nr:GNAT family N-acetyltransferase [Chitinophagaceae bacterium]
MEHVLDNMIWNAIITGNTDIAVINGNVGAYHQDIAPFAGVREWNEKNINALYDFLPATRAVAITYLNTVSLDENKWSTLRRMDVTQMVYTNSVASFTTDNSKLIVPLTEEHVPQMLELTDLTRPGPFLQRTILFGNYFGIFIDGKLVAMAGQRMHPVPYMEVSAVCTHPDFRGYGYAKAVMLHVMDIIIKNSFLPFLHVLSDNYNAIELYKSIGFSVRTTLQIDVIKKV